MPSGPLKLPIGQKVKSFPAGTINALIDKYNRDIAQELRNKNGNPSAAGNRPWLVAQIHNSTSETVEPGEILGYAEPAVSLTDDPFQVLDPPNLSGVLAAVPTHSNQFAVAVEFIEPGGVGPAVVMGFVWVLVNWTDAAHDHIRVAEGEYLLISDTTGIKPITIGPIPGSLPALVSCLILIGGGTGGGATVDIKFALIDKDIPGILEDKPPDILTAADVDLTPDEIAAGYSVIVQDPPANNLDTNHVDKVDRLGYQRQRIKFPIYESQSFKGTSSAVAASSITLEAGSSSLPDFFKDDPITVSGQTKIITAYNGGTRVATVDSLWSPSLTGTPDYAIASTKDSHLATEIVDDPDHESPPGTPAPRKVIRLKLAEFWWDDKPFKVGKYNKADFKDDPNFDPASPFPPPSVTDPNTFLKRRVRAVFINGVFVERMCKFLPPRPLPAS